jgi:ABC-2 type transport system ATP-binding protein
VLGFLGPNGAGKSTTMKMVTGYLTPTSGSAHVRGIDVTKDPIAAKRLIGYLPEGAPAYADMTPASFLSFIASVRGYTGAQRQRRIDLAIERTNLRGVLRQPIETLSKGFKRRVGLAQAILHEPDVLIMDEPTDGLDPNQKHEVRNLIRSLATGIDSGGGSGSRAGRAIILSTHILEEVEAVCTRAVVIAKGKIVADDTPLGLASRSRYHNAVTLAVLTSPTQPAIDGNADGARDGLVVAEALRSVVGVATVENLATSVAASGQHHRVTCTVIPKNAASIQPEISRLLRAKGWQVEAMRLEAGRLDDVFRELTRGSAVAGEQAQAD